MFGSTRWSPLEEMFNVQREVDRLFSQFWRDLPSRTAGGWSPTFNVNATDDAWHIEVPLPGVDPKHVTLEVAGSTLSVRAEEPGEKGAHAPLRYQQTLNVPQFLDLERITASHQHGMLRLTVPLKESVKPRRIQIETGGGTRKQITAAA